MNKATYWKINPENLVKKYWVLSKISSLKIWNWPKFLYQSVTCIYVVMTLLPNFCIKWITYLVKLCVSYLYWYSLVCHWCKRSPCCNRLMISCQCYFYQWGNFSVSHFPYLSCTGIDVTICITFLCFMSWFERSHV